MAISMVSGTLSGCLSPEQSVLFRPDWEEALERADRSAKKPQDGPEVINQAIPRLSVETLVSDEGVLGLSIEHAGALALSGNRDLAVEQLQPVIVGANELIERGLFDPELFGSIELREDRASEVDRGTGTRFGVESEDTLTEVGVRQSLPTGTEVEATVGFDREVSNRAPKQQEARLGLSVTQQLLRGAGTAVNLARIRQARLETRASIFELRGYVETLLADVESAYWRYALAQERIAIFEGSLEVARQQRDEVEHRIDVGVLAETQGAAARAEVALRELELIDARSELENQRLRLLRLINPVVDGALDREIALLSTPVTQPEVLEDIADRVELADLKRSELAEARLRLEQGRLETLMTRNGVLPRLEVFIALGKSGFGDTLEQSFRELDEDSYDLATGIRLSQALGNDAARGRREASYASRRQAAAAVENLRQLVRLEVKLAANEVERSRQQVSASKTARELQVDTVRAERERFDVGESTAILVAQVQRDLLEAEIAEVEAVVAYRLAMIQLYVAEGTLLERRGYVLGERSRDGT
ncbi:MAG: TolC family protein [Phycisphaeraceae bacterium]